ncbi:MAG: hypothetical protein WKF43_04035, partial [Acidimicrobiales bacterium]
EAGVSQHFVQHPTGGADEGSALGVLHIAGLLPHQHHLGRNRSLTEDGRRGRARQRDAWHWLASRATSTPSRGSGT